MPQTVQNVIVSLYCASFPIGSFLGATISGIVAEKYIFEWSTGIVALVFIAEVNTKNMHSAYLQFLLDDGNCSIEQLIRSSFFVDLVFY